MYPFPIHVPFCGGHPSGDGLSWQKNPNYYEDMSKDIECVEGISHKDRALNDFKRPDRKQF